MVQAVAPAEHRQSGRLQSAIVGIVDLAHIRQDLRLGKHEGSPGAGVAGFVAKPAFDPEEGRGWVTVMQGLSSAPVAGLGAIFLVRKPAVGAVNDGLGVLPSVVLLKDVHQVVIDDWSQADHIRVVDSVCGSQGGHVGCLALIKALHFVVPDGNVVLDVRAQLFEKGGGVGPVEFHKGLTSAPAWAKAAQIGVCRRERGKDAAPLLGARCGQIMGQLETMHSRPRPPAIGGHQSLSFVSHYG